MIPRWLRRAAAFGAALYLVSVLGLLIFIDRYRAPAALPGDAVIVVLGAGQGPGCTPGRAGAQRIAAALAIRQPGQEMLVTGGKLRGEACPVARAMADALIRAGVAPREILVEPRALSTLQNAAFSRDLLGARRTAPLLLVTHRFHLPRAWASFRWAGLHDLTLVPADAPDRARTRGGLRQVLYETAIWAPNLARALAASAADALGVPAEAYMPMLN